YISVDGNEYIPAFAFISSTFLDDDPITTHYYSWNNSNYQLFDTNFTLPSGYGEAILSIKAEDSLGNLAVNNITLIMDNKVPTVNIIFPFNVTSKINTDTILLFETNDYSKKTVFVVKYAWDILPNFWSTSSSPDFSTSVIPFYSHGNTSKLFVFAKDLVGNNFTYTFSFLVDLEAPTASLYVNESNIITKASDLFYVRGNTTLIYNASSNNDLVLFEYKWDNNNFTTLNSPWLIQIPVLDGIHTLTVRLRDDTGEGTSPNINVKVFTFKVDDINLEFVSPADLTNNYNVSLIYKETFTLRVTLSDILTGEALANSSFEIVKESSFNLTVSSTQLDNITYEFTIYANNITYGLSTKIEFQFYQFSSHRESFFINIKVDRKEGSIIVLDKLCSQSVIYGENITLTFMLKDENNQSLPINYLKVQDVIVTEFLNIGDYTYQLNLSSRVFLGKGNYNITVYANSTFYYEVISLGNLGYSVEILPIPVILTISVSNYTVIEGSDLLISANLTLFDGTPVSGVQIVFYIYLFYKQNESLGVFAYDYMDTRFGTTGSTGTAIASYTMTSEIDYVTISAAYMGNMTLSSASIDIEDIIITIPPPVGEGFPTWLLYTIIGGSIFFIGLISFIIYKLTRPKPFEELMKKITDEDIANNFSIISPGVILSIFDQRKGPIPLVEDHSLSIARYRNKLAIGIENFLLKIADQAYSSLGFEEHDAGRRVGSIILPSEKMIGFIHGIQLPNPAARGGFENLSLIVLADSEYGKLLLSYQEYLFSPIDELTKNLKEKKPLSEIEENIANIRKISVQIILAAQQVEKMQNNKNND
ncbi:MAG: hypothetical protein ACTSSG_00680, partial [Candidatus Heimdallarchaeaceae archaeon]